MQQKLKLGFSSTMNKESKESSEQAREETQMGLKESGSQDLGNSLTKSKISESSINWFSNFVSENKIESHMAKFPLWP